MRYASDAICALNINCYFQQMLSLKSSLRRPLRMCCLCMERGWTVELGEGYSRTESKGLNVVSVQIPLTSLADDVAATKRASLSRMDPCFSSVIPMEELSSRSRR